VDRPGASPAATVALAFAASKAGGPYKMGAAGPRTYDCSSLVQAAYARAGLRLPRTAAEQRDWLAAGHGIPVVAGQEKPGDLLFWDSYRGPHQIGHVALVWDPGTHTTIEARNTHLGIGHFTYTTDHHRFEIWRPR
jgi:cell wall-associated NlpC family hydrolase